MQKQVINMESSEFQPKTEYLLIKPEDFQEKTTDAGLVLSIKPSQFGRPTSGVVVAVGSEIQDIAVDTYVIWPGTDGLDLEFNDGDFMLLRYKSIIGSKK